MQQRSIPHQHSTLCFWNNDIFDPCHLLGTRFLLLFNTADSLGHPHGTSYLPFLRNNNVGRSSSGLGSSDLLTRQLQQPPVLQGPSRSLYLPWVPTCKHQLCDLRVSCMCDTNVCVANTNSPASTFFETSSHPSPSSTASVHLNRSRSVLHLLLPLQS